MFLRPPPPRLHSLVPRSNAAATASVDIPAETTFAKRQKRSATLIQRWIQKRRTRERFQESVELMTSFGRAWKKLDDDVQQRSGYVMRREGAARA